jgi:hypothetical protein
VETKPVANFRFRREAVMAKTLLENAGIPSMIQSAEGSGFGPIAGGSSLLVLPADLDRARAVLEEAGVIGDDDSDDDT